MPALFAFVRSIQIGAYPESLGVRNWFSAVFHTSGVTI